MQLLPNNDWESGDLDKNISVKNIKSWRFVLMNYKQLINALI